MVLVVSSAVAESSDDVEIAESPPSTDFINVLSQYLPDVIVAYFSPDKEIQGKVVVCIVYFYFLQR